MDKTRRIIMTAGAACAVGAPFAAWPALVASSGKDAGMDVFTALKTRRSVRSYTRDEITDADLRAILEAGMDAPSAVNEQPWEFVVIRNRETLAKVGDINHYAAYAKNAPAAVLLCLNEQKEKEKGMGILDVGMCAQNMMLAAHGLGIGSVFTGIYPLADRMEGFRKLCHLPQYVAPIGLIVFGYPQIKGLREAQDRFNQKAIHHEKWDSAKKTG